ncbi:type II toxin-antitoxin system RelE/ParE family toxin [Crenothrix polyspora]|jgi:plasmid stabilization system protein ParE|uniref:Plasmid stabilization system n=1 Tax=Crenothrix polyspora TaxID=360316 RepID=A0A1R4H3X5_9GAMM|nr:type II toxin-antitoxin system RelE/ParE family toxin [Crenothrix polyspora]SJM90952.1 Plasmid stabilization system [Crenothrix polyspora]
MPLVLQWTTSANRDLVRLHAFLHPANPRTAAKIVQKLVASAEQLRTYPQLGERLTEFEPHEVRRLVVGDYELRYEVVETLITVLRLWHGREDR